MSFANPNTTDGRAVGRDVQPDSAEWLDVFDLARRYQCSTRHLLRMAAAGKFPPGCKFGVLRRWSRRAIEAWEAAGCPALRNGGGA